MNSAASAPSAPRTLVVIPARGGSKGIPRKNLSPIGGKPLMAWAIESALAAPVTRVLVSTDDGSIAHVARRHGAEVLMRDPALAQDMITLDPVVHDAVVREEAAGRTYDLVLTVQPTSPLLRTSTIRAIVERFADADIDTILTVVNDTHLAWEERGGRPVPAYEKRVNRQQLPQRYRETGGVLGTRRRFVTPGGRIGPRVSLQRLDGFEGLDIDSADDWLVAEAALRQRRIAFITIGNEQQGLGHVTRTLTLLESFNGHYCRVFCPPGQELAVSRLRQAFYDVREVAPGALLDELRDFGANIVIHDQLETDPAGLVAERAAGMKVVVFEDLGPGQEVADLVINALYPAEESLPAKNRYFGPSVYCLRDEFRRAKRSGFRDDVRRALVTFGGTDPAGLTFKVLDVLGAHPGQPLAMLPLTVVAGRGLARYGELEQRVAALRSAGRDVQLHRDVPLMSELMASADVAFTSAGRTLYELAHMGVPAIVLAQNETEMKHHFASIENGFLFLGLGREASTEAISGAFDALTTSRDLRRALHRRMLAIDLTGGRDFVVQRILEG
jgi:CMP-N-acetylneuraminic acid synthetase/spore coat polysaccharide biosynthesis predicted glycosyltransferase SpsG